MMRHTTVEGITMDWQIVRNPINQHLVRGWIDGIEVMAHQLPWYSLPQAQATVLHRLHQIAATRAAALKVQP